MCTCVHVKNLDISNKLTFPNLFHFGGENTCTPFHGLKSFDMDSAQVGKAYLVKKFTLPWESNPGRTQIRGGLVTGIVSVGLKKTCGHLSLYPSKGSHCHNT